jgi:hypothetical protein
MNLCWYQVLKLPEKEYLCQWLNTYYGIKVHPGSLPFVSQRKVARFVIEYPYFCESMKLQQTCGGCGEYLGEHKNRSSSWLYSLCSKCADHKKEQEYVQPNQSVP